jgi:hypothetical protein
MNRDQLLLDLFTAALEGGIGYWSAAARYKWMLPDGTEDRQGFNALIVEDDVGDEHLIDRSVMVRGLTLAATDWRDRLAWSTEPPPVVITEETEWDYDAGDADMIVQLGLFGDVVYG